jgi:acetoin utilization protein AcuB
MFVGERMKNPVITVTQEMPIVDALDLLRKENIRRAPVVKNGKLVGIISENDIRNASPSPATSLSVWEVSYLVSKITVGEIMTKNVITVREDTAIEEAARMMADNKIGTLPVLREDEIVGIITETDLFKIFLELMGARETGVRVSALIAEKQGQLAKITDVIANAKGNFVAFGQFSGESPANRLVTFKVTGLGLDDVKKLMEPLVERLIDIRFVTA